MTLFCGWAICACIIFLFWILGVVTTECRTFPEYRNYRKLVFVLTLLPVVAGILNWLSFRCPEFVNGW